MDVNKIYDKVENWVITQGPAVLFAIFVLIAGMWLIRVLSRWMSSGMHEKDVNPSLRPFITSLVVIALRVLLLLAVLQIVGIGITVFAALVGALGVAAGLALSGTLQNFASGVIILFLKPFQVGDNIIAQGQEGTVSVIKIFYTIVTTFDNRTVVFPNSKLSNEVIVNISTKGRRRLDVEIKFGNAIDFEEVKKCILEVIDESPDVLKDAENRIGISSLEPDGYKVMANFWLKAHGFIDGKMAVQERLMQKLKQSGIKLPGLS